MKRDGNTSRRSGVESYELCEGGIIVCFGKDRSYLYNEERPGAEHVSQMRERAEAGVGLATYMSRFVRENYARRVQEVEGGS